MKLCPMCRTPYTDRSLNYCVKDGTTLVDEIPSGFANQADTLMLPDESLEEPEEKGILDFSLDIEVAFEEINRIVAGYSERIDPFNNRLIGHAARMNACNDNPMPGSARQKYQIALMLASDMNLFSKRIEDELPSFEKSADILDQGLTGLMNFINPNLISQEEVSKILSSRQMFFDTAAKIRVSVESFRILRDVVVGLVGISKDVNRVSRRLTKALDSFILNVKKVNALIDKAISLIDDKFGH